MQVYILITAFGEWNFMYLIVGNFILGNNYLHIMMYVIMY